MALEFPGTKDSGFNPHPARKPGATRLTRRRTRPIDRVSILTQPGSRVQRAGSRDGVVVSILTQPGSRVQRNSAGRRFNPHPARKPGATGDRPTMALPVTPCFNPHPARKPGATRRSRGCPSGREFQSSPSPEAGCNVRPRHVGHHIVEYRFQSSPSPEAGCNDR